MVVAADLTIDELRALARALPLGEFREQVGPFLLIRRLTHDDGLFAEAPGKATMKLRSDEILAKAMLAALDESEALVATLSASSVQGELTVGRQADCGFVLHDRSVSKHHSLLRWNETAGAAELCDLGSTNGTFINAARLGKSPAVLNDGDVVTFGDLSYTFQLSESFHAAVAKLHRPRRAPVAAGVQSRNVAKFQTMGDAPRQTTIGAVPLRRAPFRMVPCREPATEGAPPPSSPPEPDTELDTIPPPLGKR